MVQKTTSPSFVLITGNDASKLPPEFLCKKRFDELFFVDLPDILERAQIWHIAENSNSALSKGERISD